MINKRLNIVKNNFEELPNNIEAEQSVIGTILVSNEILYRYRMTVSLRSDLRLRDGSNLKKL